jgi:serine/threonine protein kinase
MIDASEEPRVSIGDYIMQSQIGQGSFATVWRAEHKLTKHPVAVKIISNDLIKDEDTRTHLVREINIIKQTDHPFIAKLFEVIMEKSHTILVMEYATRGSILNFVNSKGKLTETTARRYFSQILSALEYLHTQKLIVHRDLKAENVLLDKNCNVRLIDFGLSNFFSSEYPELSTACGSPAYTAPEILHGRSYMRSVDVWSAGILLYAMTVGQLPFYDQDTQKLLHKVAFTEPHYPSYLSPALIDLLRKILVKDPSNRWTIDRIKNHPWFSQTEYSILVDLSFSDDEWQLSGSDREIMNKMAEFGIKTKFLRQSLLLGDYNSATAVYMMMQRDAVTDKIEQLMMALNSQLGPDFQKRAASTGTFTCELLRPIPVGSPKKMPSRRPSIPIPISFPKSKRKTQRERKMEALNAPRGRRNSSCAFRSGSGDAE